MLNLWSMPQHMRVPASAKTEIVLISQSHTDDRLTFDQVVSLHEPTLYAVRVTVWPRHILCGIAPKKRISLSETPRSTFWQLCQYCGGSEFFVAVAGALRP